ncbi:MAG: hypothetical protein Q9170_000696 [Blastenia crenularia]
MPNQHLGNILQKLSTCSFPASGELDGHICFICLTNSLEVDGSETPIKLPCGHIFGLACLTKWASNALETGASPTCPSCRALFLDDDITPRTAIVAAETAEEEIRYLLSVLEDPSWPPGKPPMTPDEEAWIVRAEQLWATFRHDVLGVLDTQPEREEDGMRMLDVYLIGREPVVEYILSFGTLYAFFVEHRQLGRVLRGVWPKIRRWIPESCDLLTQHLDSLTDMEMIKRWKISEAYRDGKLVGVQERMARRREAIKGRMDVLRPGWRDEIRSSGASNDRLEQV